MSEMAYDEIVELRAGESETDEGEGDAGGDAPPSLVFTQSLSLAHAVRMVMVDWDASPELQKSAAIIRQERGDTLDLDAIRRIFEQDDFPADDKEPAEEP